MVSRHPQGRLHITKARGKNESISLRSQITDHPLGIGPLGNILDRPGLHPGAQGFFQSQPGILMLPHPAGFGDRRHMHHGDSERGGIGACGLSLQQAQESRTGGQEVFIHGVPRHGPG